jgi:hypothetical protein
MKSKLLAIVIIMALVLSLNFVSAFAGAYETSFTTSITYQNVGPSATTNLEVWFYESPSDTTPTVVARPNLNPGAGTSLFVGGLGTIPSGFQGTAVMVSDQPLVATLVQLPQGSATVKNRPLSNGFSEGSEDSLIATVLKNEFGGWYTIFSIQNVGSSDTTVNIKYFDTSATQVHSDSQLIKSGAGYFVDTGTVGALGASFNGSVVAETTGGEIISSAMELASGSGVGARAFEGLGSGGALFYMPSALCNYPVSGGFTNTAYAVQNTSLTTSTNVTVQYSNGKSESQNIGPGAKGSFNACNASGMPNGFIGSAKITSSATDIIAIGKAAGQGLSTAFEGVATGSEKLALPYVRWATDANFNNGSQQRVNIAIQNVGTTTITGNIIVKYIDRDGNVVGTHTITTDVAPEAKVNSNATNAGLSEFGVYAGGTQFGGGAIIEGPSGSELAVVARVTSVVVATGLRAGEDYNGIPIQ